MSALFSQVKGQKRAVNILKSHLASGELSHAYLFLGTEGVGKEYLARLFARYILCGNKKEDECESCKRFLKSAHPDFNYLDGSEGIKIEDVREIIESINLSPVASKRKVLLVTKAEKMTGEAANAILKTLEEPPTDSTIILTSTSEKKLPETIISRTQHIKLRKLLNADMKEILRKEFDEREVEKVLGLAPDNIGEVKTLILDGAKLGEKEKDISDARKLLSEADLIDKFKIIEEYEKKKRLKTLFDIIAKAVFAGIYSQVLEGDDIVIKIVPESMSLERRINLAKKILKIYRDLNYNVSLRIAIEEMVLEDLQYV
ncbi:MAG: DNA polymerase III subunit [Patescibacteria group bacterium]|nr:DNA polymerase III subunit [Patescibacteria group bacterium]